MGEAIGIVLRDGAGIALIDVEDAHLCRFDWALSKRADGWRYVTRRVRVRAHANSAVPSLLHRAVLRPAAHEIIDHINGDTLDNRRCNLRIVPHRVNSHNTTSLRKNTSHGVIGVTRHRQKWQAQIRVGGRLVHLGVHQTFEDAREARRQGEIMHWGVEPRRAAELLGNI